MNRVVPIVVVAYNRPRSLERLLNSIGNAIYDRSDIPLIISIDKGDNQDVLEVAAKYEWKYGEKKVVYQKENLKLRRHILKCGDYALEYGSVIILEDDLYVSPYFYDYTVKALAFSDGIEEIGGISLYNHRYNVIASEPFEPIDDNYDNWYFQFASSWGEVWTEKQWRNFIEWYYKEPVIEKMSGLPQYVKNWPTSSWLKYFIAFLIEKKLYFIYPKKSLTTNFGDAGTHVDSDNTNFQVPLQWSRINYNFSKPEESKSIYDAYYENVTLKDIIPGKKTVIDLYGKKPFNEFSEAEYALTRKELPYKVEKSFGCCMRPHDANIQQNIIGSDFFIYNLKYKCNCTVRIEKVRKVRYNLRHIDHSQYSVVIKMFIEKTLNGLKRRVKNKK